MVVGDLKVLSWSKGLSSWDLRQRVEVYGLGHLEEVEHFCFLSLIPMLVCLPMPF